MQNNSGMTLPQYNNGVVGGGVTNHHNHNGRVTTTTNNEVLPSPKRGKGTMEDGNRRSPYPSPSPSPNPYSAEEKWDPNQHRRNMTLQQQQQRQTTSSNSGGSPSTSQILLPSPAPSQAPLSPPPGWIESVGNVAGGGGIKRPSKLGPGGSVFFQQQQQQLPHYLQHHASNSSFASNTSQPPPTHPHPPPTLQHPNPIYPQPQSQSQSRSQSRSNSRSVSPQQPFSAFGQQQFQAQVQAQAQVHAQAQAHAQAMVEAQNRQYREYREKNGLSVNGQSGGLNVKKSKRDINVASGGGNGGEGSGFVTGSLPNQGVTVGEIEGYGEENEADFVVNGNFRTGNGNGNGGRSGSGSGFGRKGSSESAFGYGYGEDNNNQGYYYYEAEEEEMLKRKGKHLHKRDRQSHGNAHGHGHGQNHGGFFSGRQSHSSSRQQTPSGHHLPPQYRPQTPNNNNNNPNPNPQPNPNNPSLPPSRRNSASTSGPFRGRQAWDEDDPYAHVFDDVIAKQKRKEERERSLSRVRGISTDDEQEERAVFSHDSPINGQHQEGPSDWSTIRGLGGERRGRTVGISEGDMTIRGNSRSRPSRKSSKESGFVSENETGQHQSKGKKHRKRRRSSAGADNHHYHHHPPIPSPAVVSLQSTLDKSSRANAMAALESPNANFDHAPTTPPPPVPDVPPESERRVAMPNEQQQQETRAGDMNSVWASSGEDVEQSLPSPKNQASTFRPKTRRPDSRVFTSLLDEPPTFADHPPTPDVEAVPTGPMGSLRPNEPQQNGGWWVPWESSKVRDNGNGESLTVDTNHNGWKAASDLERQPLLSTTSGRSVATLRPGSNVALSSSPKSNGNGNGNGNVNGDVDTHLPQIPRLTRSCLVAETKCYGKYIVTVLVVFGVIGVIAALMIAGQIEFNLDWAKISSSSAVEGENLGAARDVGNGIEMVGLDGSGMDNRNLVVADNVGSIITFL